MGCHSSKQAQRDLLRSPSPLPRSKSLPDNAHVVSLTSSTLGSLNLNEDTNRGVFIDLEKVWSWSESIDRKIPKTPTETPPNEPESINAVELMAGFHGDYSPLDRRSFSFYPITHFDRVEGPTPDSIKIKNNAVIFYFTSLRGIRKTYDDCCYVKSLLKEYNVKIDERDVSMHSGFKEELKEKNRGGSFVLPRVFIEERDLGVEEVKRMHENGELGRVLKGFGNETGEECEECGDVRFVLCGFCCGSSRVYEEEEEEEGGGGGEWRRCSECNENGIVRCSVCC